MTKLPNLAPGKILILPGADMVLGFMERMEVFALAPGHEMFAEALKHKPASPKSRYQGINRISIANLIVAMYVDMLHETSRWARIAGYEEESATQKQWTHMVKDWNDRVDRKLEQTLYRQVIEPVFEEIHNWVLNFDGSDPSWHVWYVRRMGLDIIIEKGQDYRVLDWTRRMEAGVEYLKLREEGDLQTPSPDAWMPDAEGRRFAELMALQQRNPLPVGKSKLDAAKEKQRIPRGRGRRQYASTGRL